MPALLMLLALMMFEGPPQEEHRIPWEETWTPKELKSNGISHHHCLIISLDEHPWTQQQQMPKNIVSITLMCCKKKWCLTGLKIATDTVAKATMATFSVLWWKNSCSLCKWKTYSRDWIFQNFLNFVPLFTSKSQHGQTTFSKVLENASTHLHYVK